MKPLIFQPKELPLSNVVKAFWQVSRGNEYQHEIIIPKGVVEIIFNFTGAMPIHYSMYNKDHHMPRSFVQGYHNKPITLELPKNQSLFGVVLHAAPAKYILGMPTGEIARRCVDMTLIEPCFHEIWHQLADLTSFHARINLLSEWILQRLASFSDRDRAFNALLSLETNRKLSVAGISDWLCYSPRQLSRKFYQIAGMNTEQTLLYLKYLKAKRLIHNTNLSLSQIAYSADFSDQSHFIKTFREFTNLTPGQYRKIKSEMEGHYFENVR
ncbi:MAG: helix-turn-helix transcriptional regulator [Cyclobacteriaceae bacterium]|nr:helix-turn-helix transcriptional regulator [Cyclobacteriaceae bacterium]